MTDSRALPTDSEARKRFPLFSGLMRYFPAALAGVSRISRIGNDKHRPGLPLGHARGVSTDHADCVVRHLVDCDELLARFERHRRYSSFLAPELAPNWEPELKQEILDEVSAAAWRLLALSQELHERFGAPLAPAACLPNDDELGRRLDCLGDDFLTGADHAGARQKSAL